ncbi:hypothetical protein ACFOZ7_05690 [Natribaculum luteum]|uniref:Histidine kinase n=1 Tax=Natribaculum luteum TaxID=1586232 RepID=A0ABD5NXU1_9EURY|nr:hypothetical protein [Natribaculum luteum]
MGEAPGIPRVVLRYWAVLGFFLVPISLGHTLFLSPTLIGSYIFSPELAGYVMYTAVSWFVIYTALTVSLFRVSGVDSIQEFFEDVNSQEKQYLLVFIAVFVNTIVLIGALLGFTIGSISTPALGITIAVVYPIFELRFMLAVPTPARLVIQLAVSVAHMFGAAKDVTADALLDSIARGKNNSPPSSIAH